jgi:hypothetical protein
MSRKRPSVFDSLDLSGEEASPPPESAAVPAPSVAAMQTEALAPVPVAPPPKPAVKSKSRPEVQHTSIYVPKLAYRKIREIANTEDRKPHDVIMQGVDMVLAKYGFPSLAEFKKGRK